MNLNTFLDAADHGRLDAGTRSQSSTREIQSPADTSANEMLGQLKQGYADHQMSADWAARMLHFMEVQAAP